MFYMWADDEYSKTMFEVLRPHLKNGVGGYAIVGGLASIPFSLGYYWWMGMGDYFSTLPVLFGALLAGYLAWKDARRSTMAGIGAGIIGGLPGYVWILPQLIRTVTSWSSPFGVVVALLFVIPMVVAVAAIPGWIGGLAGGWVAEKVGRKQIVVISS